MGEISRNRRLCAAIAATLAWLALRPALAADLTFNVSLVGSLNPLSTGPGSTNNWYADLWAEGDLVVLGSVSTSSAGGVTIINNADPANPVMVSRYIPPGGSTANGQFRDVIIRNGIGYFGIDGNVNPSSSTVGGLHIVNLSNAAAPVKIAEINGGQNGFVPNHDLFLDGDFLYIASNRNRILKVFDVANPATPIFVRDINTSGVSSDALHDMTVVNGRMYTSNLSNGITDIYDVTNIGTQAPVLLGSFDIGTRNHSNWPSADGNLLAVARETAGAEVQLWNISTPASASLITSIHAASYGIDSYSAHNPVIIGDTLYVSWYQAGLQIFNIRNPASPIHLGAYDTFPGGAGNPGSFSNYDGNWGLYPWFGNHKILLSDFDHGFFTVDATAAFRQLWTYAADNGKWQENARWDNGAGPFPNSSEMIASFTHGPAGATRTVTVDGALAPIRVAKIEFDADFGYTLQATNAGEIELKTSSGAAEISVAPTAASGNVSRINLPLNLQSNLNVINNAGASTSTTLELSTIKGASRTITFSGSGESALVAANPNFTGNIVINSGRVAVRHAQAVNHQPIALAGGTLSLRGDSSTNFASNLTASGVAALNTRNDTTGSGQTHTLGDITVSSGTLTLTRDSATRLQANNVAISGTFKIAPGGSGANKFTTVNPIFVGKLDLTDSQLILTASDIGAWNGSNYTGITGRIKSGRGNGTWNGNGGIITSMTQATTSPLTTLAIASNSDLGRTTFGGIAVSPTDVLIMYTYGGDANLSGTIDADDYFQIDRNYGKTANSAKSFFNGDFDYDGDIDADDYFIIDFAFSGQTAPFGNLAAGVTTVPEPAASIAACIVLATALRRRRKPTSEMSRRHSNASGRRL